MKNDLDLILKKGVKAFEVDLYILDQWQSIVNSLAKIMNVPAALIMRLNEKKIEVFRTSLSEGNPYKLLDNETFFDSGLYCETVVRTDKRLQVPNALNDENWKDNPDVKLNMISYLGFPIKDPNDNPFGTLCILDDHERHYSEDEENMIVQFKNMIENHLQLINITKESMTLNIKYGKLNQELNDALAIAQENISKVKLLTQAIEQTDEFISIVDTDGIMQYVNESLSVHTGYKKNELIGEHIKIFKSGVTMPEVYKELWNTVLNGNIYKNTLINAKKDKQLFYEEMTITPVHDEDDKINSFIVTGQDVTERIELEEKLIALATKDTLTGIYNRHKINEEINLQIANHKRYGRNFSLLMIDIDYFKNINDTYGHDIGDYALKEITSVISKSIRVNDIFGRWGGEEFILILPEEDKEGTIQLATKLKSLIANNIFKNIEKITISIGVSLFKENDTQDTLIKRADEALYKAKNQGRNRVSCE